MKAAAVETIQSLRDSKCYNGFMGILDNLEAYIEFDDLGKAWKDAPDWCDDCNSNPGEKCPDCGYTHNC